jgi:uncharacterized protein
VPYIIGFIIAMFIALTGVGAGTVTVPVLILFLGVPAAVAVGIGLMFSSAVKLIMVPSHIVRRNVHWRTLGFLLLGGAPGVIIGSLFLKHLAHVGSENLLHALLGLILVSIASWQLLFFFRPAKRNSGARDRGFLLSWLMLPVGAEVGFSSAGAGALGTTVLLTLTSLEPAQVVGTDITFGFVVSVIGSGMHWFSHASNTGLLLRLIVGGVVGAIAGTLLITRIPRRQLRFALWVVLLMLGGQLLFSGYHAWAHPHKQAAGQVSTVQPIQTKHL